MNDLQLHIYQLLQEMDSLENNQIEEEKIGNVEKSNKPVSHKKEKFLTLSSKPITLGKRSTSTSTKIEEKPEIEHLLNIVERESIKDKE